MRQNGPIRVLLVDDSALVRSILTRVLQGFPDITVVGGATDATEARDMILQHRPNVVVLDLELPRIHGLTFLRKLKLHYPVPVIVCSGVAPTNSEMAMKAIELGAIDVVAKPNAGGSEAMRHLATDLAEKIRAAYVAMPVPPPLPPATNRVTSFRAAGVDPSRWLIAVGASTGGTDAIKEFLSHMPADSPGIAIVQHMPPNFTNAFAQRLSTLCPLNVSEAQGGELLTPGVAVVARGGVQMKVIQSGRGWQTQVCGEERVSGHAPSVDFLFDSVADAAGHQAVAVLLTGMGADGARGMLKLRRAGGRTFAQNRESCVVYGMPKVAADLGAVEEVGPPADIPAMIVKALARPRPKPLLAAKA